MVPQGKMHIGPVAPAGGPSTPAPGSVIWVKEATPPGGAAAASGGGASEATPGSHTSQPEDTSTKAQGKMHTGPVAPAGGPSTPAPGSAIWVKEATPPGGAAAAAAPAGSDDMEGGSDKGGQKAAAGGGGGVAGGAPTGPDLSKILPSYEEGVPETRTRPEGGSFGTFLKDTLLGPSKH